MGRALRGHWGVRAHRWLSTPSLKWLLVAPVALTLAAGLFLNLIGGFLTAFLEFVYAILPLFLAPLGVHLAVRDRSTGMAAHRAPTPLTRTRELTINASQGVLYLLVALASTLPATLLFLSPAVAEPWRVVAPFLPWSLLIGSVALLAGLSLGVALPQRPQAAHFLGFTLAVSWWVLAAQAVPLAELTRGTLIEPLLEVALSTNPAHAAIVTLSANPGAPFALGRSILLWLVGPWLMIFAAAWVSVGSLQDSRRWSRHPSRSRVPTIFAAALITCSAVTFVLAPTPAAASIDPSPSDSGPAANQEGPIANAELRPQQGFLEHSAGRNAGAVLILQLEGEPGSVVALEAFDLSSSTLRFSPDADFPQFVTLEEPEGDPDTPGRAEVRLPTSYTPLAVQQVHEIEARLTIDDGEHERVLEFITTGWRTSLPGLSIGAASAGTLLSIGAIVAHRRGSRWR